MWIERTIYTTAYKLPGILRWFEVKSVFMVRMAPTPEGIVRSLPQYSLPRLLHLLMPHGQCVSVHTADPTVHVTTLPVLESINISSPTRIHILVEMLCNHDQL